MTCPRSQGVSDRLVSEVGNLALEFAYLIYIPWYPTPRCESTDSILIRKQPDKGHCTPSCVTQINKAALTQKATRVSSVGTSAW